MGAKTKVLRFIILVSVYMCIYIYRSNTGEYHEWKIIHIHRREQLSPKTNTYTGGNEWWWGYHNIAVAAEKQGSDKHTQTKE